MKSLKEFILEKKEEQTTLGHFLHWYCGDPDHAENIEYLKDTCDSMDIEVAGFKEEWLYELDDKDTKKFWKMVKDDIPVIIKTLSNNGGLWCYDIINAKTNKVIIKSLDAESQFKA